MKKKRIEKLGGKVNLNEKKGETPRVMQTIAVTRAFGDSELKKSKILISEPEFTEVLLMPDDQFVVIGSDGLWDVLSDEQVITTIQSSEDKLQVSQQLVHQAIQSGSNDNISCLVIYLTWNVEIQ